MTTASFFNAILFSSTTIRSRYFLPFSASCARCSPIRSFPYRQAIGAADRRSRSSRIPHRRWSAGSWGDFGAVKPSYHLRVSFLGEIPPTGLAALLHVLHHLELFLYKADVRTEGLHHLAVKDTPENLGEIRQVPDRCSVHAHGTIGFRTVAEIPRVRRGGTGFLCFRLRYGTGIQ